MKHVIFLVVAVGCVCLRILLIPESGVLSADMLAAHDGWYGLEHETHTYTTFRWSQATAQISFPSDTTSLDFMALSLTLAPIQEIDQPTTVEIAGIPVLLQPSWQQIHLYVPATTSLPILTTYHTVPHHLQRPRGLGIAIRHVTWRGQTSWPYMIQSFIYWLILLPCIYLSLRNIHRYGAHVGILILLSILSILYGGGWHTLNLQLHLFTWITMSTGFLYWLNSTPSHIGERTDHATICKTNNGNRGTEPSGN